MDLINQHELNRLVESSEGVHVSMFMPLASEPDKRQANQIHLKNLLKKGRQMLAAEDFIPTDLAAANWDNFFQPVEELLDANPFTEEGSSGLEGQGLALFLSPEQHHIYHLPLPFEEEVVVGPRFHIKPLLPLLDENGRFYLLTLSQNQVQLWHGTRLNLEPIDVPDLPQDADAALALEDPERELQFHTSTKTATNAGLGQGGERPAVFHGHDANTEKKGAILRYFREVNKAVANQLTDEQAPLMLAAVKYLWPIYKEVNTYAHLLDEGIPGNTEQLNATELHKQAWTLMQQHLEKTRQSVAERYQSAAGTKKTSESLTEIVPAAAYGRIHTLFITADRQKLGFFEHATGKVEMCQNDSFACEDLFNLAATSTLQHGGQIYAVQPEEMPTDASLAAIFRYAN